MPLRSLCDDGSALELIGPLRRSFLVETFERDCQVLSVFLRVENGGVSYDFLRLKLRLVFLPAAGLATAIIPEISHAYFDLRKSFAF